MRIIVCGSRGIDDTDYVSKCMEYIREFDNPTIITGGAKGVDTIAHNLAYIMGYNREVYPANWKEYGRSAGMIRNKQMLDTGCDLVIAVYDKVKTIGTSNMTNIARRKGVPVVEFYNE